MLMKKLSFPNLPGLFHGKGNEGGNSFFLGGKLVKLRTSNWNTALEKKKEHLVTWMHPEMRETFWKLTGFEIQSSKVPLPSFKGGSWKKG